MTGCFWRTRCFCGVVVALILSGCAVHPLPEDVTRRSTLAIVKAIRCEAKQAVIHQAPDLVYNGSAIGFLFDFNITEFNSAGLNLGFNKVFPGGTFNLTVPPTSSLQREAERKFTMVDTFLDLKNADCSQEAIQSNFAYPIAGSIGLNEVIGTAIGIDKLGRKLDSVGTQIGGQAAVFSDELTYTTKLDTGNVVPSLSLDAIPGVLRLVSASATLQSNREDVHKLTLAIALPEPLASTPKAALRAAARQAPAGQVMLGSRGIPSKVLIHSTQDPKLRVLWELDRRVLLGQEDRLINSLSTVTISH
jgi:hypothetical protein